MSPMLLTGAGWLLSALGIGGFFGRIGVYAALLGFGILVYGLQLIRWRNEWLARALWLAVVALLLWLVIVIGLVFGRAQFYTLALTQAAIAFTMALGVQQCFTPSMPLPGRLLALKVASIVVALTAVIAVVGDAILTAGADLPQEPFLAVLLTSLLASIVFGGLLLTLSREPALQAES